MKVKKIFLTGTVLDTDKLNLKKQLEKYIKQISIKKLVENKLYKYVKLCI